MRYMLTSGEQYDIPGMCSCCEMSTAGAHQSYCPLCDSSRVYLHYAPLYRMAERGLEDIKHGRVKPYIRG